MSNSLWPNGLQHARLQYIYIKIKSYGSFFRQWCPPFPSCKCLFHIPSIPSPPADRKISSRASLSKPVYLLQNHTLHVVMTLRSVSTCHTSLWMKVMKHHPPRGVSHRLLQVGGQFRVDTSKAAAASSASHPETWSSLGILQQGGGSHGPWTGVGTAGSCCCTVLSHPRDQNVTNVVSLWHGAHVHHLPKLLTLTDHL